MGVTKVLTKSQARLKIRKINSALGKNVSITTGMVKSTEKLSYEEQKSLSLYDLSENFSWKSYVGLSLYYKFLRVFFGIALLLVFYVSATDLGYTVDSFSFNNIILIIVSIIVSIILVLWGLIGIIKTIAKIWTSDWNDDGIYDEGLPATKEQINLIIAGMRSQGEYISDDKVKRLNRASAAELINQINDRMFEGRKKE